MPEPQKKKRRIKCAKCGGLENIWAILKTVAVVEQAPKEATLGFWFLGGFAVLCAGAVIAAGSADSVIADDVGVKFFFGTAKYGVGTAGAVSGLAEAARVNQPDAAEVFVHGCMGVTEADRNAVFFFSCVEQFVIAETGALRMTVGDEDSSVGSFYNLAVGPHCAVAVASDADNGNAQIILQLVCVALIVAAVENQVYSAEFFVNFVDTAEAAVGIAE